MDKSTMSSDLNQAAERLRRWRHATIDDIGSIARFGDTTHKHEPWEYGILDSIQSEQDSTGNAFVWYDSEGEERLSYVCQIQTDSPIDDDEPITEEWMNQTYGNRKCPWENWTIGTLQLVPCHGWHVSRAEPLVNVNSITTRRQLRQLLKALQ